MRFRHLSQLEDNKIVALRVICSRDLYRNNSIPEAFMNKSINQKKYSNHLFLRLAR